MDPVVWLNAMINGYRGTAVAGTAARLGLADHLAGGCGSVAELAAATGADPGGLRILVRAMTALGLVTDDGGRLRLTAFGNPLRSDHPSSLGQVAAYVSAATAPAYDGLHESLRVGGTAFEHRFGARFYDHLARNPGMAGDLNGMLSLPGLDTAVAEAVDLSHAATVVDVGGGNGAVLAEVLRRGPHLRGVVFDLPAVLALGAAPLEDPMLEGRWTAVGGDFLEEVPSGDCLIVARVLANWPDEAAERILRTCRRALGTGQRLLVIEQALPERVEAGDLLELGSLDLFVNFGGRLRTEEEFRSIVVRAGLHLTGTTPLDVAGGRWAVLEAVPGEDVG